MFKWGLILNTQVNEVSTNSLFLHLIMLKNKKSIFYFFILKPPKFDFIELLPNVERMVLAARKKNQIKRYIDIEMSLISK